MAASPSEARPAVVDRATFEQDLKVLRTREKAYTRDGDAIAAARRWLPMLEVAGGQPAARTERPGHPARRVRRASPAHRLLRYRAFMGWGMPRYSAQPSLDALLVGREHGLFHLV